MSKVSITCISQAEEEDPRALLFKGLLSGSNKYILTEKQANITVFNSSYIKSLDPSLAFVFFDYIQSTTESLTIVDVDDDYFENAATSAIFTTAVLSAHFVTCTTPHLQERIYDYCGRLAAIIENPVDPTDFVEPEEKTLVTTVKELDVVWFGHAREIFSIKPYTLNSKYNLQTVLLTDYQSKVKALIKKADIIFLPKTFTPSDEYNRYLKVEQSVKAGKFVVAPDLEFDYNSLAFDGSLEGGVKFYTEANPKRWVKKKQKLLLDRCGRDNSYNQLISALDNAPKDNFVQSLNYYL